MILLMEGEVSRNRVRPKSVSGMSKGWHRRDPDETEDGSSFQGGNLRTKLRREVTISGSAIKPYAPIE